MQFLFFFAQAPGLVQIGRRRRLERLWKNMMTQKHIPDQMTAVVLDSYSGPEALRVEQRPVPSRAVMNTGKSRRVTH